MRRGWYGENHRHYLASIGVKTYKSYKGKAGILGRVGDTVITAQKLQPGHVYPVDKCDVEDQLRRTPEDDRKGLKVVAFVEPKTQAQKGAWAQQIRSKKKILIFAQPKEEVGNVELVRRHMKQYVLPHEMGHYVALTRENITDKDLSMAEARADAYAAGMSVKDKDVKVFKRYHVSWAHGDEERDKDRVR
jgi:hypothetical protein